MQVKRILRFLLPRFVDDCDVFGNEGWMIVKKIGDECQVKLLFLVNDISRGEESPALELFSKSEHLFCPLDVAVGAVVRADTGHMIFGLDLAQQVNIRHRI